MYSTPAVSQVAPALCEGDPKEAATIYTSSKLMH
jgi:hypothetical protein